MSDRPKRLHRDPYGQSLLSLVAHGEEAIRQLGGVSSPRQEPDQHEPDDVELRLYRDALNYVGSQFGADVLRAAVIAAGIEDGDATDDDLDFDLYEGVLDYIKETFGEDAEKRILAYLESRP